MTTMQIYMFNKNILIIFIFLHCHTYRYYFHNPKPLVENNTNLANAQQKKVGLVGFYKYIYLPSPFYYEYDLDFIRTFYKYNPRVFSADLIRDKTMLFTTFQAFLAEEHNQKSIGIGKSYKEFKEEGLDESIVEEKIGTFVTKYLADTNRNTQIEIKHLISIKNQEAKFIKREIDYYVVGVYSPSLSKSTTLGLFTKTISSFLSIPTFLTIPFIDRESISSKFLIYDNKLNLKKEFIYEDSYWSMNAWWVRNLENKKNIINTDITSTKLTFYPPQFHLDKDNALFSKDLENFINAEK